MKFKEKDIIYRLGKFYRCLSSDPQLGASLEEYTFSFLVGGIFITGYDGSNPNRFITIDHNDKDAEVIGVLYNEVNCCAYPTWDMKAIEKLGLVIPPERLHGTNVFLKKDK